MSGGASSVAPSELLARFIFYHRYVRQPDLVVKPEAFMPHPGRELSVIRRDTLGEEGIWKIGRIVDKGRQALLGRADVSASAFKTNGLEVSATPKPDIALHADVVGWPSEKPKQKAIAIKVAIEASKFLKAPANNCKATDSSDNQDLS